MRASISAIVAVSLSCLTAMVPAVSLDGYRFENGARQSETGTVLIDSSQAPAEFTWRRYAVNLAPDAFRPEGRYRLNFRCKVEGFGAKAYLYVLVRPYSCVGSEKDVLALVVNPKPDEWQTFSVPVNTRSATDYRLQFHSHNRIRAEIADVTVEERPPLTFVPAVTKLADEGKAEVSAANITGATEFDVDLPQPANDLVLDAADFGVREDNPDNTEVLRAALAAAKAQKAAVLNVAQGVYRFTSDAPMTLADFTDFTFDGHGSTFVSHRSKGAFFDIRNCTRLRLKDFSVDWDWTREPLASLVKIVRVDPTSFDIEFVDYDDFPCKSAMVTIFSAYDPKTKSVGLEDGITRAIDMSRKPENRAKKTWLDGRTLRVHEHPDRFAVGQLYRLQHYYYHMNGFCLSDNAHLRLENVKVLSTPGHAFVMSGRQHHTLFDHVDIVAPTNDPRRVITCTADHLHIGSSQGFIKLESCEFSLGADDIMNMHDNSGFARGYGPKTVRTENAPCYAHLPKGTRVEIRNGDYSPTGFIGTVVETKPAPGYRASDITFEEEIPQDRGEGFILFDRTYDTHNVIVRNCTFHDNRARGLLILARDVTVENNVFRHQEMGAIKIETGYTLNLWSEGYGVSNVVIRGNLFDTVNPSGSNTSHLERSIYAGIYLRTDPSTDTTDYPIIKDILIEKNIFRDTTGVAAYLSSVHHVVVRDNVIEDPTSRRRNLPYRSQFHLVQAKDVAICNNVYRHSPYVAAPGVTYDPENCSDIRAVGNRVTGFEDDLARTCECRPRGGLPNVLAKLQAGETVRIAYLGGSISEANGWRPMTLAWFRAAFPKARIEEINATISGTGSDYGAIRLPADVLSRNPDLLFVEFRVNGSAGFDVQSTEGIVRQTFAANPRTDICFVYTLCRSQLGEIGKGRQTAFGRAMERVCEHYGIPSIDFGPEIVNRMSDPSAFLFQPLRDALSAEVVQMDERAKQTKGGEKTLIFAQDGVHPGEAGHRIYCDVVVRSLTNRIFPVGAKASPHVLPEQLSKSAWIESQMVPAATILNGSDWKQIVDGKHDPVYGDSFRRTERMLRGGVWTTREGTSFRIRWIGSTLGFSDIPQARHTGGEPIEIEVIVDGGAPQTFRRRRTPESKLYSRFVYLPEYAWGEHEAVFTIKKVPEGQRCILGQFLVVGKACP